MHRRNEISDGSYEQEIALILKGREFPILTDSPDTLANTKDSKNLEIELRKKENLKKHNEIRSNDINSLTTCNEKSKRNRKNHISKQKKSRNESLITKSLEEENLKDINDSTILNTQHVTLTTQKNIRGSLILNESISTNSVIFNAVPEKSNFKNILLVSISTILLLTTIAFVNFGYTKNKLLDSDISKEILEINNKNMNKNYFGPVAINQCNEKCIENNGPKECSSICRKLSFIRFPRRLSLLDNSPRVLGARIVSDCLIKDKANKINSNLKSVDLDGLNLSRLLTEYKNTIELDNSCIQTNKILAKIGQKVSSNYKDNYSSSYYERLSENINEK